MAIPQGNPDCDHDGEYSCRSVIGYYAQHIEGGEERKNVPEKMQHGVADNKRARLEYSRGDDANQKYCSG